MSMHSKARTQKCRKETAQSQQEIRLERKSTELSCDLLSGDTYLPHHPVPPDLDEFSAFLCPTNAAATAVP